MEPGSVGGSETPTSESLTLAIAAEARRNSPTSRAGDAARGAEPRASDVTSAVKTAGEERGAETKVTFRSYRVQPGDTISEIAEQFGVTSNTIIWANGLDDNPDQLKVGQELRIPSTSGVTHVVKAGDTIGALAERYEADFSKIVEANGLQEPYLIKPGDTIFIPGAAKPPPLAGVATGRFVWPTYGRITTYFMQGGHKGLDIANGYGTPISAADGGVVVTALKLSNSYGWHVIIDHGNGFSTLYGHLSEMYVDYGDRVRKGDVIGLMGSTGYSTGPHLHFEVRLQGILQDPLDYLP